MTMQVTTYFEIAFSFGNKLDLIFRVELLLADGSLCHIYHYDFLK